MEKYAKVIPHGAGAVHALPGGAGSAGRRGAGLLCHPYPGACVRPYLPGMGAAA